jgi:hypothetical protein
MSDDPPWDEDERFLLEGYVIAPPSTTWVKARKPGQRGPGKHRGVRKKGGGNKTPQKQLTRQQVIYWRDKAIAELQERRKKGWTARKKD